MRWLLMVLAVAFTTDRAALGQIDQTIAELLRARAAAAQW